MSKLVQHLYRTAEVLDSTSSRMDISLLALNWIMDEEREAYYSSLCEEDLPHNMQILFTELKTIHSMISDEVNALRDYRFELSKGNTNVQ